MPQKPPRTSTGATPAEPLARKDPARAVDAAGSAGAAAPAGPAAPVGATEAAAKAERVQGAAAVDQAEAAAPVSPAVRSELVSAIARRLRAGDLSPQQAVEELIEDTVRSNLGGGDAKLAERLRVALRSYVEQDPFLAARVKGLERKR